MIAMILYGQMVTVGVAAQCSDVATFSATDGRGKTEDIRQSKQDSRLIFVEIYSMKYYSMNMITLVYWIGISPRKAFYWMNVNTHP